MWGVEDTDQGSKAEKQREVKVSKRDRDLWKETGQGRDSSAQTRCKKKREREIVKKDRG